MGSNTFSHMLNKVGTNFHLALYYSINLYIVYRVSKFIACGRNRKISFYLDIHHKVATNFSLLGQAAMVGSYMYTAYVNCLHPFSYIYFSSPQTTLAFISQFIITGLLQTLSSDSITNSSHLIHGFIFCLLETVLK